MTYLRLIVIIGLLAGLGGCHSLASDQRKERLSKLPYPKSAPLGEDVEVVVKQGKLFARGTLYLTNITPRSYHDVQVWLNQQYVTTVPAIPISTGGDSTHLKLAEFIDSHVRSYPVGGWLTPEKGFPVVLAEMFDPASGRRHRMLVRR